MPARRIELSARDKEVIVVSADWVYERADNLYGLVNVLVEDKEIHLWDR